MADDCASIPSVSPFAAYREKQRIARRITRHGWDPERAASTPALRRGRPLVGNGIVDSHTRHEDDIAAQLFVATFKDGASQESIGEALGMSRENTRLVLNAALEKLRASCRLAGITEADLIASIASHPSRSDHDAWDHDTRYNNGSARGAKERAQNKRIRRGPQSQDIIALFRALARAEHCADHAAGRLPEDPHEMVALRNELDASDLEPMVDALSVGRDAT